jgi:hypothetical protein
MEFLARIARVLKDFARSVQDKIDDGLTWILDKISAVKNTPLRAVLFVLFGAVPVVVVIFLIALIEAVGIFIESVLMMAAISVSTVKGYKEKT